MQHLQWFCALALGSMSLSVSAEAGEIQFTSTGELALPADYRQWMFVSSGLGMTYGPVRAEPGQAPFFTNVFVNPEAYELFSVTGTWPDGTLFFLEVRESEEHVSINAGGRTQGTQVLLEASVKDSTRFPGDGWAFFTFEGRREAAIPLPRTESCYGCHAANGAVEWTFAQFYPELMAVARALGTVRADYKPARELE